MLRGYGVGWSMWVKIEMKPLKIEFHLKYFNLCYEGNSEQNSWVTDTFVTTTTWSVRIFLSHASVMKTQIIHTINTLLANVQDTALGYCYDLGGSFMFLPPFFCHRAVFITQTQSTCQRGGHSTIIQSLVTMHPSFSLIGWLWDVGQPFVSTLKLDQRTQGHCTCSLLSSQKLKKFASRSCYVVWELGYANTNPLSLCEGSGLPHVSHKLILNAFTLFVVVRWE